ncbi:MAG: hypothetical protein RL660_2074, partial [Bacteroidota bacterium]
MGFKKLLLLLLVLAGFNASAQTGWFSNGAQNTAVTDVWVCSDTVFKISIRNLSGTQTLTSNLVTVNLPSSLAYVPSSVFETTTGSPIKTVVESNISNLQAPVFSFNDLAPGEWVTFNYKVKAACGLTVSNETVLIQLNNNQGASSPNVGTPTLSTVNIVSPLLDVTNSSAANYSGVLGNIYAQCDTVVNTSTATLDFNKNGTKAFVVLDFVGSGLTRLTLPSKGTLINDTLWLNLADITASGNFNSRWEPNEKIWFCYNVRIDSCENLNRVLVPGFGCNNVLCGIGSPLATSTIVNNFAPNLNYFVRRGKKCFDGTFVTDSIRIQNSGLGAATQVDLGLSYYITGSGSEIMGYDTSSFQLMTSSGTIIPISSSMITAQSVIPSWNVNCLGGSNLVQQLTVQLPGSIAPGDDVFVIFKAKYINGCTYSSTCNGIGNAGHSVNFETYSSKYKDQCGNGNYSVNWTAWGGAYHTLFSGTITSQSQTAPGAYKLTTSNNLFHFGAPPSVSPRVKHWVEITVPPCFTLAGTPYVGNSGASSYTYTASQVGNVITVRLDKPFYYYGGNEFNVPLTASCVGGGCAGGVVSMQFKAIDDTACVGVCPRQFGFVTKPLSVICPTPCPNGGADALALSLTRISFGQPDNDNNQIADASGSLNMSLIRTDKAMAGDTILLKHTLRVQQSSSGISFPQLFLNYTATDMYMLAGAATVQIYPRNSGFPVLAFVTGTEVTPGVFKYVLNLSTVGYNDFNGDALNNSYDSIIFEQKFRVTINQSMFGYQSYENWNADAYAAYTPSPNSLYVPTPGADRYQCTDINTGITIGGWTLDIYTPDFQVISGCSTKTLITYNRYDIGGNNIDNIFPYEVRRVVIPDTMQIRLPKGLTYVPGSGRMYSHNGPATYGPALVNPVSTNLGTTYDTLTWKVRNQYISNGGTLQDPDEAYWDYLYFDVYADCRMANGVYTPWSVHHTATDGAAFNYDSITPTSNGIQPTLYAGLQSFQTILYNGPSLQFTGGGAMNISYTKAFGSVTLQNLASSVNSQNTWVKIVPLTGSSTLSSVKIGGTTINPIGGYYQLGIVNANSSKTLDLEFNIVGCTPTTYAIYAGYYCSGYPPTAPEHVCATITNILIDGNQPPLEIINTFTNVNCIGTVNATIDITANGGVPGYQYNINGGAYQFSNLFNNLGVGTYTICAKDTNNCVACDVVTIALPSTLVLTTDSVIGRKCFGTGFGKAHFTASGGNGLYQMSISPTGPTIIKVGNKFNILNCPLGTYTVTVIDYCGNTVTSSFTITQPTQVNGSIAVTNLLCNGGGTGVVTASGSGGTPTYTYQWLNAGGPATATWSSRPIGTYTVQVKDNNGCTTNVSATITQPPAIVATMGTPTHVACFGNSTGSLSVSASGGTGAFTYLWSGALGTYGTANPATGLPAGTFTVVVTDANGCTRSTTATITQPASALSATMGAPTHVNCFGQNTGSATVTASGGTIAYAYLWSNGQTSATLTAVAAGSYTVTVTDSKGCTRSTNVTITQPTAALTATMGAATHINCFGQNTGGATVTAAGGTSAYTYLWSNGQTSATLSNVTFGTYSVTITDSKGCTSTSSVTITQPSAALNASIGAPTHVSCFGGNNGAATVTAAGGTSAYSYLWNNGQTSATLSSVGFGTYTVTITDSKGCTSTSSVTITQPAAALAATMGAPTHVNCFGLNTGAATVSAAGGTTAYSYLWSNGQTSATLSSVVAASYTVTVTDSKGCTSTSSVTITQPTAALTATIGAPTHVNCFGQNNGAATVTAAGGTSPYTYSWNNGQTNATLTNVTFGTYAVTITDSKGCTSTSSVTITQPSAALAASIGAPTHVNCFGGNNGAATASASGGTSAYTYSWNNGQTSATLTAVGFGSYTVTVTDSKGCTSTSSVTITQPAAALSATIGVPTHVTCFGLSNGSATASATGGTTGYSYFWSNGQTSATLSAVAAASYTVTITDAKGCTSTSSVTITQPSAALTAAMGAPTHVSCFGQSTGAATVTAAGGTSAYSYAWNNSQTAATLSSVAAGSYTVTITDSKGCTSTSSVTITQPPTAVSITGTSTTVPTCTPGNDGTITLTATGGVGPYTYSKTGALGSYNASATLNGYGVGTFTVYVKDANGCTATTTATIVNAALPSVSISINNNVSCFGGADGSLSAVGSGGTLPYTYSWNPGGATTATVTGLSANTYTVTLTDANNCSVIGFAPITQPTVLSASIGIPTHVTCFGLSNGSATASGSGGTTPYTYAWSNGQTSATLTAVVAGTYTVTITDAKSCTSTSSVTITQPTAPLTATMGAPTHVLCFSQSTGAATVTAAGGTSPYTYAWSNGQTSATLTAVAANGYTVTITDSKGCTSTSTVTITQPPTAVSITGTTTTVPTCVPGNDGTITITASGGVGPYTYSKTGAVGSYNASATLPGYAVGTYTVYVKDANGCTATTTATIVNAAIPSVSISINNNVSCFGGADGSLSAVGSGGTLPYTYSWSPGGATTATVTGLSANTYTVTLTDANNCSVIGFAPITQPSVLVASIGTPTHVTCFGLSNGSATASGSGGTTPYTYAWSNGQTSATLTGVVAATYTVTITDAKSCTSTSSVTITQPTAPLTATMGAPTHVLCFSQSTGAATVTAAGGTSPYTYAWSNGQTSATLTSVAANGYTVTITDSKGCTSTSSVTITQPPTAVSITGTTTTVPTCVPGNDGTITISASGGVGPYSYSKTGAVGSYNASAILTGYAVGTFTVYVQDANGCTASTTATVINAALPNVSITVNNNVSCFGGADGSLTAAGSSGTLPYTYSWSPSGATTATVNGLNVNTYTVTLTDANNCTVTSSAQITQPSVLGASVGSIIPVTCFGLSNGSAVAIGSGGTTPYSYSWNNAQTSATLSAVAAGTYTVTITDAKNCTSTSSVIITEPAVLTAAIPLTNIIHVSCYNAANGSLTVNTTGGNGSNTFVWTNSTSTSASATNLAPNTYQVTITDAKGCTSTASATITQPTQIVINSATLTQVACTTANGTAQVSVSGGTPSYDYQLNSNGWVSTSLFTGLATGTYTIYAKDANG